jgi:nucleoside-diphosphate-sugar epimerase
MHKRILITGISGFLGSQIAKNLILQGHELIATKRTNSILWRCKDYDKKVTWININEDNWQSNILEFHPEIIIHTAWSGVSATDRDDWDIQLSNIEFTLKLLQIAKKCKLKKFIGFGSQAEYGNISGIVDENYPLNPNSAYGSSKISVSQIINNFCSINEINWYWFRLFSFFGELESSTWFIPTLIDKISSQEKMDMTPGEQKYAYMYVGDLASIIVKTIEIDISSGIYNISSKSVISLLELTNKILEIIKPTESKINFGAIPYRPNQSMHIQGSIAKLEKELGEKIDELDLNDSLSKVVNYRLNKY